MADNEAFVLLDLRGMVLHGYHKGTDPEGIVDNKDGKTYNTAGWGLNKLLETYPIFESVPPRQIIACYDGGSDYRIMLWPSYKEKRRTRKKTASPVLVEQSGRAEMLARDLFDGLGITQVRVPGVEADDVIAFLCQKLHTNPITVFTNDQDLLQLAGDYERVNVVLSNKMVKDTHKGTPLNMIRLYKSIVGDSSDEYPGVPGLGDKTWDKMLKSYGHDGMQALEQMLLNRDMDSLRQTAEAVSGTPGDEYAALTALYENFDHWHLMYQLAALYPSLCEGVNQGKPVKLEWRKRVPSYGGTLKPLQEAGAERYMEEFKKWLPKEVLCDFSDEGGKTLQHFQAHLKDGPIVAFDYEAYDTLKHMPFQLAVKQNSNYVDVMSQAVTGVSFCYGNNYQHVFYMPCRHTEADGKKNYEPGHVAWAVEVAAGHNLVAHNASFEDAVTKNDLGLDVGKIIWDTLLMAAHVDEEDSFALKHLSRVWLEYYQATYQETLDKAGVDDMSQLSATETLSYGCDDSIVAAHLFDLFWLVVMTEGTWDFIREREFEFTPEQVRGFLTGVKFDVERIKVLDDQATIDYDTSMETLKTSLAEHCSKPSQAGATALFLDLQDFADQKFRAATEGRDPTPEEQQKYDEKKQELWQTLYRSSRYVPYQRIVDAKPIKPTPKPLTKVAEKLGFSNPGIEKVTKKFLTEEWIPAIADEAQVDEQKDKFLQLIKNVINAKAWKKYESDEYLALSAYCTEVLGGTESVTEIGDELNFDSPNQMQQMLYGKLGLPIRMRSKVQRGSARAQLKMHGSPATNERAIAMALAEDVDKDDWRYPIIQAYAKAKKALTAKKLFYRPIPMWIHPKDGVTHPSIKNCGTVTRRPSGTSPNMLQLTKKDEGALRASVRPRYDDHVIISADFAGQELRIVASESKDPVLLDAYLGENKKDVHSVTAAAISSAFFALRQFIDEYGIQDFADRPSMAYEAFMEARINEDTGKAMNVIRKAAKGVNFLIVYMGGYTTLAMNLLVAISLAKSLMEQTFKKYARIKPWQQETIEFARTHGYTETAYGSRRHLGRLLFSNDDDVRSRVERQGVNAVIQGCAADILKVVMSEAHRTKLFRNTGSSLIAPVYDELASSVPRAAAIDYCFQLKEIMELTPPGHAVPMVAEFSMSSDSWGRVVEIGADITPELINETLDKEELSS